MVPAQASNAIMRECPPVTQSGHQAIAQLRAAQPLAQLFTDLMGLDTNGLTGWSPFGWVCQ